MDFESFHFVWSLNGNYPIDFDVEVPIPYPFEETPVCSYASQIAAQKRLPQPARCSFEQQLTEFCKRKTEEWLEKHDDEVAQRFLNQLTSRDEISSNGEVAVKDLSVYYSDEFTKLARRQSTSTDSAFVTLYRRLVETGGADALSQLLDKERSMATEVDDLIRSRDFDLERLKRQHESIVEAVSERLDTEDAVDMKDVGLTAARHFEKLHTVEANYASQLSALSSCQRRDYATFVQTLCEHHSAADGVGVEQGEKPIGAAQQLSVDTSAESTRNSDQLSDRRVSLLTPDSGAELREESFTIYLGAQQKSMHNLRLSVIDPVQTLCRRRQRGKKSRKGSFLYDHSSRLQVAMNLYGNRLCGLVLLVDSRPNYHVSFHTDFARACEQATELHFDSLDDQLEVVEKQIAAARRSSRKANDADKHLLATSSSVTSDDVMLSSGDVYLTRHSNLTQVHVGLHLVAPSQELHRDINSRHACINGIRNVIRLCAQFGITTISLPLLLVDRLSEETTVQWCLKRAELIFKCVKGFLIEVGALSTYQQHYTVQFLLPPDISQEVYGQIHEMLPTIFHLVRAVTY